MEQRPIPIQEPGTVLESHPLLSVQIGQNHAITLTRESPKVGVDPLVSLEADLQKVVHRNKKRTRFATWFAPAFYVLSSLVIVLGPTDFLVTSPLFYLSIVLILTGVVVFLFGSDARERKRCKPVLESIIDLNDVRAVGLLVDILRMNYWDINQYSMDALIDLLPRLQSDEDDLLDREQRAFLCAKLGKLPKRPSRGRTAASEAGYRREAAFRIAILHAFARIGDSAALTAVEALTRGDAYTAEEIRIQEAAQACLPLLQMRAEQARSNQTLLRPSSASDPAGETLLRAVVAAPETHPEQLLRPHQPNS
jgi:hypothetical protein